MFFTKGCFKLEFHANQLIDSHTSHKHIRDFSLYITYESGAIQCSRSLCNDIEQVVSIFININVVKVT